MPRNVFVVVERGGAFYRRMTVSSLEDGEAKAASLAPTIPDGEVRVIPSDKEWKDITDDEIRAVVNGGRKLATNGAHQ